MSALLVRVIGDSNEVMFVVVLGKLLVLCKCQYDIMSWILYFLNPFKIWRTARFCMRSNSPSGHSVVSCLWHALAVIDLVLERGSVVIRLTWWKMLWGGGVLMPWSTWAVFTLLTHSPWASVPGRWESLSLMEE